MNQLQLYAFIAIIFISATSALEGSPDVETTELAFRQFQLDYQKIYSNPDQHLHAFECFKENLKISARLNKQDPHAEFGIT